VPCPLFLPGAPLGPFPADAMPLGDLYSGRCAADKDLAIPDSVLRQCCNIGYARGQCPRAAAIDADAARFLIRADRDGVIEVAWSTERDHHPVAVGTLRLNGRPPAGEPLEQQAYACVSGYLRRTGRQP